MKLLSLIFLVGVAAFGVEISSVKVTGDNQAHVQFMGVGGRISTPTYKVIDNSIELSFTNSNLSSQLQGKLDVSSPHALIHRVSLYEAGNKTVKALIVINGSLEALKNRMQLAEGAEGFSFKLDYPRVGSSTLDLLKEEQMPLKDIGKEVKKEERGFQWFQLTLFLLVVVGAGIATFFVVKFAKAKGNWGGSRKYLIEQLSYVPVGGTKSGVALVKVGAEFVLLGVTQNQITYLSALPKLQKQYEEENKFEQNTFNEAIEEQISGKNFTV